MTVLEAYLYSLAIICVIFGIYSLGKFLLRIRRIKTVDYFFFWAECTVCGWKGEASRVLKKCPVCYSRRLKEVDEKGEKRKKKKS